MSAHTKQLLLVAALCALNFIIPAHADADTQLLSKNATYRITGGGYVYASQIQPGVNERARKEGIVFGPLVEPTDAGDDLIDGDPSDQSKVHTTWSWDQPGKVIVVEMTLPGESVVKRVQVTFPEDTDYRPESASIATRGPHGGWIHQVRNFVHFERDPVELSPTSTTFQFDGLRCQELQFTVGGNRQSVGITEIEVWGDGPIESAKTDARGLIRTTPHVQTVAPPATEVPQGSVNLSSGATIRVDTSHSLSSGSPETLIDGIRMGGVRMGGQAHQHWHLSAELDLGDVYQIDAVQVWMPGGRGVESGHVHEVKLAISPSQEDLDWDSPTEPLVPVYWPTDDAPKPYVIPAGGLNVPGRRVRVEAYLSGTGGVTSQFALGEIEVWGRAFDAPLKKSPQLKIKPVHIEPEPIADLAPKWQALRKERIRGIWIGGDLDDQFGDTRRTKAEVLADAGFNVVVLYTGVDQKDRSQAPDLADRIERNVREARKHDLMVLAKWQFGSSHLEPYRHFREEGGRLHESSCCPLQKDYIERHIGRWAVECARLGADGFTFDCEMYGSDSTHYSTACYCDACFRKYLEVYSTDWQHHFERIAAPKRGQWIVANQAGTHYTRFQRQLLIAQFDAIRQRCRDVAPNYLLAYAPFVGYLRGLTQGLGTSSRPVIVWSEREYTRGPESRTIGYLKQIRDQQMPALYASGHMLWFQDPEKLADNLLAAALHTDGWWAWFGGAILNHTGVDDPEAYKSPYGRAEGTSAMDYLRAIKTAHERLDELLEQPPETWPRAELFKEVAR